MILSKKKIGSIIFLLYICIIENIIKKTNMDCRDLKRGDVININWGSKKRIAIFDKYDKSMGDYDALHIYIELDDVSNEL